MLLFLATVGVYRCCKCLHAAALLAKPPAAAASSGGELRRTQLSVASVETAHSECRWGSCKWRRAVGRWFGAPSEHRQTSDSVASVSTLTSQHEGVCFIHWSPIYNGPRQQPLNNLFGIT